MHAGSNLKLKSDLASHCVNYVVRISSVVRIYFNEIFKFKLRIENAKKHFSLILFSGPKKLFSDKKKFKPKISFLVKNRPCFKNFIKNNSWSKRLIFGQKYHFPVLNLFWINFDKFCNFLQIHVLLLETNWNILQQINSDEKHKILRFQIFLFSIKNHHRFSIKIRFYSFGEFSTKNDFCWKTTCEDYNQKLFEFEIFLRIFISIMADWVD